MNKLAADEVLNPNAPFENEMRWVAWKLRRHEVRRTPAPERFKF
jgi:hypothetical protein